MKIGKKDLLRINNGFGGNLRSSSSLDYAFEKAENKKLGPYRKLAYLFRAILVDHPFSDGTREQHPFWRMRLRKSIGDRLIETCWFII